MNGHVSRRWGTSTVKIIVALGLGSIVGLAGRSDMPSASAMSCFAVAGNLTCIDTASAPVVPFVPPVMVPSGVGIEGDDEHIVIRDNGGRHIARG